MILPFLEDWRIWRETLAAERWLDREDRRVFFRAVLVLTKVNRALGPRANDLKNLASLFGPPVAVHHGASVEAIDAIIWSSRDAARLANKECLHQAAVAHLLLKGQGYASRFLVGGRVEDGKFAAHAWVEIDGEPLFEPEDSTAGYRQLFLAL